MTLSSARILIVDDHGPRRSQLRAFLADRGLKVCGEAVDGGEAVEEVSQLKPAVVLLDIYMPTLNGFAAAYEIRKLAPDTKVVFFDPHRPYHSANHTKQAAYVRCKQEAEIPNTSAVLA